MRIVDLKNGSCVVETDVIYPCTIRPARYSGVYSGAQWHAWPCHVFPQYEIPTAAYGDDTSCAVFWDTYTEPVGKGKSPQEAFESLRDQLMQYNNQNVKEPSP